MRLHTFFTILMIRMYIISHKIMENSIVLASLMAFLLFKLIISA